MPSRTRRGVGCGAAMPSRTRGVRGDGARDAKPHKGSAREAGGVRDAMSHKGGAREAGGGTGSFRVARPGHFEQKRPFVCGSESGAEKSIQIMREKVFSKKAFSMYDRLVPSFP